MGAVVKITNKKATAIIMGAEDKGIQVSLKKELDEIINILMNPNE